MSKRMNRDFVMLAEVYNKAKHRTAGMYMSEKLDGMRGIWIPHTRGKPVNTIPFANRGKDKREHVATGLWSRYGKVIHCPPEFTIGFPPYPLDGELYMGRKSFQKLMSTVKELEPGPDWKDVQYLVFDAPDYNMLLQDGRINGENFKYTMNLDANVVALGLTGAELKPGQPTFDFTYRMLRKDLQPTKYMRMHDLRLLPFITTEAVEILETQLNVITDAGGEGLILRHPAAQWEPIRSKFLLKVKKLHDAEAIVLGYRTGQGKYLGMLGSLSVRFGADCYFELSGFTDEERQLPPDWCNWAAANPDVLFSERGIYIGHGADSPASPHFHIGDSVTFRFRELSDNGIPKEARYLRKA